MMQAESSGMRLASGLCPGKLLECSADCFLSREPEPCPTVSDTEPSENGGRGRNVRAAAGLPNELRASRRPERPPPTDSPSEAAPHRGARPGDPLRCGL